MNDEAARLALAEAIERNLQTDNITELNRDQSERVIAALRAQSLGTQAPIQVRELKRELRISSDHDYRPWFEIQEAFKRLTPPALVAQIEALEKAVKFLDEIEKFCCNPNRTCNDPDAECPIAMGEWFSLADRNEIASIREILATGGEK